MAPLSVSSRLRHILAGWFAHSICQFTIRIHFFYFPLSNHQKCSVKKMFLTICQNIRENTCVRAFFLKKKKEPLTQSLPVNFDNFFKEHLRWLLLCTPQNFGYFICYLYCRWKNFIDLRLYFVILHFLRGFPESHKWFICFNFYFKDWLLLGSIETTNIIKTSETWLMMMAC